MARYVRLMGPTAAGKTAVAVALRDHLPVEIVSVDSAMVYRGMDIGTGKPDAATLARAPHRLIDVRDPRETYSAADFARDARAAIAAIAGAGRIPLLVGGTGLYFRALHAGLSPLPAADAAVRERIASEAAALGWPLLHERLARIDPGAAARVHPHDRQRIQRGLEIWELSGRAWTDLLAASPAAPADRDDVLSLVIAPRRRGDLHRAIARRFEGMLAAGLVDEVARLRARGDLHLGLASMRAVGYRQAWEFLAGRTSRADMVARALVATRQLARRQLTWLRREPECGWVLVDEELPGGAGPLSAGGAIDALLERFERWWDRHPGVPTPG